MAWRTRARIVLILLGIATTLAASPAVGEERYYAIIFGSQSRPKRLKYTHTWATFVRVVGEGNDPSGYQVDQHTISWLPETLTVKVWSPFPEEGVNLDLYSTLDAVGRNGESVTAWGPFEIRREGFERSMQVRAILESGAARYRAISTPLNLLVSDCIHAVAAVDPDFGREYYPLIRIGKPASRFMARQLVLRSRFDQDRAGAEWLIPRLGLDRYPIEVVSPHRIPRRYCFLCRCPER